MQHSIVYSTELVKALERIKAINVFTDCVRKNILRIIEPCFFRWIPGKNGGFRPVQ